jgi:hypothetical protein
MTEERPLHPQDPAEGDEESVPAPGADKAGADEGTDENTRQAEHPQEPAEGAEEDVESPGAGQ